MRASERPCFLSLSPPLSLSRPLSLDLFLPTSRPLSTSFSLSLDLSLCVCLSKPLSVKKENNNNSIFPPVQTVCDV